MPRPLWKGAITFGLVSVPVSLVSATERSEKLSFNLLHKKDGARIEMKRFCTEEEVEVPWSEVVRGYQVAKGKYVVMDEADFDRARTRATEAFDVRAFVGAEEIDSLYFDTPYYVAPAGKSGLKAYALLRDALKEAGRVGVGTIVFREREHLAALEPEDDALVLTTMRFAHEIRSPDQLDLPRSGHGYRPREMKLARQLIDALTAPWNPDEFEDTYTNVLRRAIKQRSEGKAIAAPAHTRPPVVHDLMEALRKSVAEGRRPAAKAAGRKKRKAA